MFLPPRRGARAEAPVRRFPYRGSMLSSIRLFTWLGNTGTVRSGREAADGTTGDEKTSGGSANPRDTAGAYRRRSGAVAGSRAGTPQPDRGVARRRGDLDRVGPAGRPAGIDRTPAADDAGTGALCQVRS